MLKSLWKLDYTKSRAENGQITTYSLTNGTRDGPVKTQLGKHYRVEDGRLGDVLGVNSESVLHNKWVRHIEVPTRVCQEGLFV